MTELTIGELSERSGVATSAIRYYEDLGLVRSRRTTGNQRRYERAMLRRLAFIRTAQRVGLSLDEIETALATLPSNRTPDQGGLDPAQPRLASAARRADPAARAAARHARLLHRLRLPEPAPLRAEQPGRRGGRPGPGCGLPRRPLTVPTRHSLAPWRCTSWPAGRTRRSCDCPGTHRSRSWSADYVVPLPRGLSRHIVRIVRLGDRTYAVKETQEEMAFREYRLLRDLQRLALPAVRPLGVVTGREDPAGEPLPCALMTEHLAFSLPYRALFAHGMSADSLPQPGRRARRPAGPAPPGRLLLGRRLAVERAVPPQRRRVRGVPRRRRDR